MTLTRVPVCTISMFQLLILGRLARLYHSATGLLLSVDKYLITFHQVVWLYITALSLVLHSSDYYRFSRSPKNICRALLRASTCSNPCVYSILALLCTFGKSISPFFLVSRCQLLCSDFILASIYSKMDLNKSRTLWQCLFFYFWVGFFPPTKVPRRRLLKMLEPLLI